MTPFNKKSGGFKKPFRKAAFGGHGKEGRAEMHAATCSDCGKGCEVPFRPTGERPVYCRDCFASNMPPRDERAPRRDFGSDRKPFRPREEGGFRSDRFEKRSFSPKPAPAAGPDMSKLVRQLEVLTASVDKLSSLLESSVVEVAEEVVAEAPAEKPKKKKKKAE